MRLLIPVLLSLLAVAAVVAADADPLASSINSFSVNLFAQLSHVNPNSDLIVSPFSVSTALAILLLGARGETASEISQTLRLNSLPADQSPHQLFKQVCDFVCL